jgi:DNA polymerase IV
MYFKSFDYHQTWRFDQPEPSRPDVYQAQGLKIEEIVRTAHLRKLDFAKLDERVQILNRFMKIYGVALHASEKFASAGYKTIDDLLQKA